MEKARRLERKRKAKVALTPQVPKLFNTVGPKSNLVHKCHNDTRVKRLLGPLIKEQSQIL